MDKQKLIPLEKCSWVLDVSVLRVGREKKINIVYKNELHRSDFSFIR